VARQPEPEPKSARLTPDELEAGVVRISRRIEELETFNPQTLVPNHGPATAALKASIEDALAQTFGHGTVEFNRYRSAATFSYPLYMGGTPPGEIVKGLEKSKARALALLHQSIQALKERIEEQKTLNPAHVAVAQASIANSNKVFLVHGHEGEPKEAVARFLEKIGLNPIILHEQPNLGQTAIEKFEKHADVGFAIVLLTPDDVGGQGQDLKPRARQNVILELGYFIGRLTRERVCAMKAGDLELPSDILGTVWIDFDAAGGWHQKLGEELAAAGYEFDWNLVMKRRTQ
jgi:predicted nucleotide-binding protein